MAVRSCCAIQQRPSKIWRIFLSLGSFVHLKSNEFSNKFLQTNHRKLPSTQTNEQVHRVIKRSQETRLTDPYLLQLKQANVCLYEYTSTDTTTYLSKQLHVYFGHKFVLFLSFLIYLFAILPHQLPMGARVFWKKTLLQHKDKKYTKKRFL